MLDDVSQLPVVHVVETLTSSVPDLPDDELAGRGSERPRRGDHLVDDGPVVREGGREGGERGG